MRLRHVVCACSVVLLLAACSSSGGNMSVTASPTTSPLGSSNAATATVAAPTTDPSLGHPAATSSSPVTARWLVGDWTAHTLVLTIDKLGTGRVRWRTYRTCGEDPTPCDTFKGDTIIDGGRATIRLAARGPTTASGRVVSSTDPADLPLGSVTLRFDPSKDVIHSRLSLGRPVLCGPHAAALLCG
jgi:hypothetical protein